MINRNASPTAYFWNCLGSALFVASIGVSISVARTETMSLELARYKLKTGAALTKVQQATESTPIPERTKRTIDRAIDEAETEIEKEVPFLNDEDDN